MKKYNCHKMLVVGRKVFKSGLSSVMVSPLTKFYIGQDIASKAYYVWTNSHRPLTRIDNIEEYKSAWRLTEI